MNRSAWLVFVLLLATGCGTTEPPVPVHPATGTVTYKGQPADGLVVQFCPTDTALARKMGGPSNALVGPDGTFAAGTFAPRDGLPVGTYKLAFFWTAQKAEEMKERKELEPFKKKYGTAKVANRTVEVREGPNPIDPISLD